MPLKGAKKKYYNKKYYADNKEKIADKKGLIIEMLKRVALTVLHEPVRVTRRIRRRVALIVLHEAVTVIRRIRRRVALIVLHKAVTVTRRIRRESR